MERRLTVILAADVVGYSRLMGAQEEATLSRLEELRGIVGTRVSAGKGRIFSLAGENLRQSRHGSKPRKPAGLRPTSGHTKRTYIRHPSRHPWPRLLA